jgi:hypothetical protein
MPCSCRVCHFLRRLEASAEYDGCFNRLAVLERVCTVKVSVSEKELVTGGVVVGNVDWSWGDETEFQHRSECSGIVNSPFEGVLGLAFPVHRQWWGVEADLRDAKDSNEVKEGWYKLKTDLSMSCDSSVTPATSCIISSSDHVAAPCADGETASRVTWYVKNMNRVVVVLPRQILVSTYAGFYHNVSIADYSPKRGGGVAITAA